MPRDYMFTGHGRNGIYDLLIEDSRRDQLQYQNVHFQITRGLTRDSANWTSHKIKSKSPRWYVTTCTLKFILLAK